MTTSIPTSSEEARLLQERIERTHALLRRAMARGKSLTFCGKLADAYVRQVDRMLDYKRARNNDK